MVKKLKLPALDGQVMIDSGNVSVINDEGLAIRLSVEEWELLRDTLRFDDSVDYERGETPMTIYQLQVYVELMRKNKELEIEIQQLKSANHQC